jgi:hypothetical protein
VPVDAVWQRSLNRIRNQEFDHSGAGSGFKVSRASAPYVRSMWAAIGAIVMGRNLFDLVNGWEGHPAAGDHVVVVSHRPKPEGWHPEASYHSCQILAAGLVDEVAMDVVLVVFGSGKLLRRYRWAASTGRLRPSPARRPSSPPPGSIS